MAKKRRKNAPALKAVPKRRPKPKNAPASAPWRAAIARTRQSQDAIDAEIAGVDLPLGPVIVLARDGREPTREELIAMNPRHWAMSVDE